MAVPSRMHKPWSPIAVVAIVLCAATLVLPASAHALSWANGYPAGTVTVPLPAVGIDAFGIAEGVIASATITVDGIEHPAGAVESAITGHWVCSHILAPDGLYHMNWQWSPDASGATRVRVTASPSITTTGVKTAVARIRDKLGNVYTSGGFSFTVIDQPTGGDPWYYAPDPNPGYPVGYDNSICTDCHGVEYTTDVAMGPDCVSCHYGNYTPEHGYDPMTDSNNMAVHQSTVSETDFAIQGIEFGTHQCSECHESTNLIRVSGHGGDCATCHPAPRDTLSSWGGGCSQGGCHTSGPTAMHADIDPIHTFPADSAATCIDAGCHDASPLTVFAGRSIAEVHSTATTTTPAGTFTSCGVCHSAGLRLSATCVDCHPDRADAHGYDAARHTAELADASMAGTMTMALYPNIAWKPFGATATYYPNPDLAYHVDCSTCHSADLGTQHDGDCGTCHPSPRRSIAGSWDKSCDTAACHSSYHGTTATVTPHSVAPALKSPILPIPATLADPGIGLPAGCSATAGGKIGTGSDYSRTACHAQDLIQEHNRKLVGGPQHTPYVAKVIAVTCATCHSSPGFDAISASGGWDGTCTTCHPGNHTVAGSTRHNDVTAMHDARRYFDAGYNSSGGVRVQGSNTMDAHGPYRTVGYDGASLRSYGCAIQLCHLYFYRAPRYAFYGWNATGELNACWSCHGSNTIAPTAYGGSYAWWSGQYMDDWAWNTQLTLDLSSRGATLPADSQLKFKTWYDTEENWDYAYVMASTDRGLTWTRLAGSITTTRNPLGQALGPNNITGQSAGWVDGIFNLSAYAGTSLSSFRIQFNYICDASVQGEGWMLDDLSLGTTETPIFTDDMETRKPEWRALGRRGGSKTSATTPIATMWSGPPPEPPALGSYRWATGAYTNNQTYVTTLTLTPTSTVQPLPANSALAFTTYYDTQNDRDYGYVKISTNGGATWTSLAGSVTTTSNPYARNLGNGITGQSLGWRSVAFDLSAYAGQTVRVCFTYDCGANTHKPGWWIDQITLGPTGSPIFADDIETLKPEWAVTSSRSTRWAR